MVMPFVSAEGQVDEQAPPNLRASMWLAGIQLGWHAPATEADTVRGYEIARERRSQAQRTSTTLMADTGSTETTDTDDSVVAVGYYYVQHMRALRDGATSAWSNEAIIDPAARTFSPAGSGVNLANPREAAAEPTLIGPSTVDYPENSTVPVATYSASDSGVGVISWSLDGTDLVFFSLTDGELSFKQPPNYENPADADADNEYEVTVVATDSQDESASLIVTVTVTDVDDPNVVLIMADDAGVELFGAYGSTQYRTPRLDALAALGARFSHAYASPSCTPTRVALMTGRYGVRNYVNFRHLAPTEYTFTDMFNAAGYATAIAGKWHLDGYADRFVIPMPGITAGGGDYRAAAPGQENQLGVSPADSGFASYCLTITNATGGRKYWQPSIDCNGQIAEPGQQDYGPDIFTDFIVSFIESNQDRRFFAYYSMALPHSPFIRPPWRIGHCRDGNDDQCNFEDMVAYLDHNVGRIYDKLSDLDLLGNTVLIFTSDNGTTREIISQLNGQAIAGDKGRPTPGGTNVPLIVLAPGDGARVIDDLIDFTDFLPTLAEVIGFQVPEHVSVDGVSFWDRLQGRAGLPREWIYTFFNPYPYDLDLGHPPVVYVRDKRYQLFKDGLFFDVEADPLLINPLPSDDEDSREARGRLQGVLSQFDSDGDAILWDLVPSRPHLNKHPLWRPVLRSAAVDGNMLTLTYAGTIDTAAVPTAASYTAQVDGTERAVVNVEVSTSTVALTLASAVTSSQSVTVSYTPGKRALRHREREGVGGQPAIPLSSEAVTNESPPNARPLFAWDESGNRNVAEGTAVGSAIGAPLAAGDADRDTLTYAVSGDDALYFELDTLSGELRTKAALNYESKTEYAFTVSIRDGKDAQNQTDSEVDDELDVTVAVTNVDEPPVVAGPTSIEFAENRTRAVATTYQAEDPEGNDVSWRSLAGDDRSHFTFSNGTLRFKQPPDYEARADHNQDNHYVVRLRAFDGDDTSTLEITVSVANVDEAGSLTLSSEQPLVGTELIATLTDLDEGITGESWSWHRSLNGNSWTPIASAGGRRYTPLDIDLEHFLRVTANYTDGHGPGRVLQRTANQPVAPLPITNTAPLFPNIRIERSVPENSASETTVGLPVTATDAEDDTLSYTLSAGDVDAFTVDSASGQLLVGPTTSLDYETRQAYSVSMTARDPSGASATKSVSITVQNIDERPEISGPTTNTLVENATRAVATYTALDPEGEVVRWSLAGDDRGHFTITAGTLRFKQPPDYEARADHNQDNNYEVRLRAFDGAHTGTLDVTVTVTNVDEAGSLTLSSEQPLVGTELTATLTDPDQVQAVQSWAWERSRNRRDWTGIASETTGSYVPSADTVERFLRVTATYDDGHGTGKVLQKTSSQAVAPAPIVNTAPFFPDGVLERSVTENSAYGTTVGPPVTATDVEDDTLSYTLTRGDTGLFTVDSSSGQLLVGPNTSLDHEDRDSYRVTMTASDPSGASASKPVSIAVLDINEAPVANNDSAVTDEDIEVTIDVLGNDRDPEDETLTLTSVSQPGKGLVVTGADNRITYQPNPNLHGVDSFTYTVTDGNRPSSATVSVTIVSTNDPPSFASPRITRSVSEEAQDGDDVGPRVTATDVDRGDVLSYRMSVSSDFAIVAATGQIVVAEGAELNADSQPEHVVTVEATDPDLDEASIEVVITVTAGPDAGASGAGGGGGGGGGPPPVPIPSDADFDWNVTRDVEALDGDNDLPTDIWSDGATLWVVENSAGGPDAVFAYRLEDGERVAEFEFGLDSRNRFSHGIWSDGETAWIADSGQDKLFAYDLESGERLQERDLELDGRNRDPRGIWSNRETIFVLDSGKDALFIYDLDSGKLRIEYALVKLNQSPRGIWSDGVTIWISDDGAKRLFAYRIESEMLNRDEGQEFTFRSLLKAGNGDARGIWSDGDVVYVADELDQHVYTYNLPDAIDARLASLRLSDVEINEFSPGQLTYITRADSGATVTTVQAIATQEAATVVIVPADADGDAENGHQITLNAETEISVTVTSSDGSRTKSYRVLVAQPPCLTGLTAERLSEVMFIGGSLDELGRCAREREVAAFFYWTEVAWLLYAPDAPAFLSRQFNQHFEGGIPAGAPLVALSTEEQRTDN